MADISTNNDNNIVNTMVPPVTPQNVQSTNVATDVTNIVVNENPEDLDTRWTRWRCMVCNYTYEGRNPLKKCPRCGNEYPDKFNDVD